MPGKKAIEIYKQLKAINPDVITLIASGFSIAEQASELLDAGCQGFIQKPYKPQVLSEKMNELVAQG